MVCKFLCIYNKDLKIPDPQRYIREWCVIRTVCISCTSDRVKSSSFLFGIISHVYHSSISVLYERFSTLGVHATWRNRCFERFCIRSIAVHLGLFVCQATFWPIPLWKDAYSRCCSSSGKNAAELGAHIVWKPVRDEWSKTLLATWMAFVFVNGLATSYTCLTQVGVWR